MSNPPNGRQSKRSLDEVHRSVSIPVSHWWRRLFAFAGPDYLVSVGYMDPGGHGHRGLLDLFYGETITSVRHKLSIPVVAVKG